MIICGIDPGMEGALCVIEEMPSIGSYLAPNSPCVEIEFHDTPTYKDGSRTRIDFVKIADLVREIRDAQTCEKHKVPWSPVHAFIEKVQSSPQMGVTSAFSFGQGYGAWLGILAALQIPHTLITPQAWKKGMMYGEPKEKDASRVVARRIYPVQMADGDWLSRKKDHNRADALLIAEYGRRLLIGRPRRG